MMTPSRLLLLLAAALAACAPGVTTAPGPTPVPEGGAPLPTTRTPATPPTGTVSTVERGREFRLAPPATARYALVRFDTLNLEMPNGDSLRQHTQLSAWVRSTASQDGSAYRVSFTLDSLMASAQMPVPPDLISATVGTRWTATMRPDGTLDQLTADRTTLLGAQVESMLRLLSPRLPGETVRIGATWSDTTDVPLSGPDISITEHATMNYVVTGAAVRGARTVVPITGTGQFSQKGSAVQFNQVREIDATGTRGVTIYLGSDGVPAGFEGSENLDMTITVPSMGQSMNVRQQGVFRGSLEP